MTPRAKAVRIFGLAAEGVCRAANVTIHAVRSYRTFSPLLGKGRNLNAERRMGTPGSRASSFCILRSKFCLSLSGFFSVALSVELLRLDVIKLRALCSSDFPHAAVTQRAIISAAATECMIPERFTTEAQRARRRAFTHHAPQLFTMKMQIAESATTQKRISVLSVSLW